MQAIHLIQRDPTLRPWPTQRALQEYESGYWSLAPGKAQEAAGASIYFHEKQTEPSFFGGIITKFRIKQDDPWKNRIIFTLQASLGHKGIRTERGGWSMEMKFVD